MNKEKTPLIMFYRNGNTGAICIEFSHDLNQSIAIEQQMIGAIECYLQEMKDDLLGRIKISDDERDRHFT